MKMTKISLLLACAVLCCPVFAVAFNFGTVDAAKLFSEYSETQRTKAYLEGEKGKLQQTLDAKKKVLEDLDNRYLATAKRIQELRDSKKEAEARKLEDQLRDQREKLVEAKTDMEKFFSESQRHLYEVEEKQMGSLSKDLDEQVDRVIQQVAAEQKLDAVFEKRFCYQGGKDITDLVISRLNAARGGPPRVNPPAQQQRKTGR